MSKNGMKTAIEIGIAQTGAKKMDIAKKFGCSTVNMSNRLKTGKFSYDELQLIAEAIGCKLVLEFQPLEQQK